MRLTLHQQKTIIDVVQKATDNSAEIILFGSRVDDNKKGGDIDLLLIFEKDVLQPAALSAKISAQLFRAFQGKKVDILLSAPNLNKLPIHKIAQKKGIVLL